METMTIQELDRLVSKTELTPTSKQVLRRVRKAIMAGQEVHPVIGNYSWRIEVDNVEGQPTRFSFSMRRHDRRT
jgi:hypothetical protein